MKTQNTFNGFKYFLLPLISIIMSIVNCTSAQLFRPHLVSLVHGLSCQMASFSLLFELSLSQLIKNVVRRFISQNFNTFVLFLIKSKAAFIVINVSCSFSLFLSGKVLKNKHAITFYAVFHPTEGWQTMAVVDFNYH